MEAVTWHTCATHDRGLTPGCVLLRITMASGSRFFLATFRVCQYFYLVLFPTTFPESIAFDLEGVEGLQGASRQQLMTFHATLH